MSGPLLTVVAVQLRGFEPIARELGEKWARGFVEELYRELTDVAVGHEALIEPLSESRVLLSFPWNVGTSDAVLRAVRCALDVQNVVLGLRNRRLLAGEMDVAEMRVGLGVASGANLGDPPAARDRALRLVAHAGAGGVYLDEATHDRVARQTHELRLRAVRGEEADGTVYRCERRRPALRVMEKGE